MKKRTYPKLYFTWRSMRTRCNNPSCRGYANYGGRGIKVCDRWQNSFKAFVEDMGPKPKPTYQLDRIDNDGDYTPENCRWVSRSENLRNTRINNLLTYKGVTKPVVEWAEGLGIERNTLKWRLKHWSLERAMTTPRDELATKSPQIFITYKGQTKNRTQWAKEIGITSNALKERLQKWPLEKAMNVKPQK